VQCLRLTAGACGVPHDATAAEHGSGDVAVRVETKDPASSRTGNPNYGARETFPNGSLTCSYYDWIREVATKRNSVLREGLQGGNHRSAAGAERRVDDVILEHCARRAPSY